MTGEGEKPVSGWTSADMADQTGKRFAITGATGGLGFESALALARAGGEVLLTGRDPAKGEAALSRIRASCPDARIAFRLCDVARLASVAAFADALLAEGRPLDCLINNAGVMAIPERRTTVDGFEMQFGTNVVGHFLLTARLLPLLRVSPAPRTVQLASLAHRNGRIVIDDLNADRGYRPWPRYQQSKLAMLMIALELQRRSDAAGWGLTSLAAHPGVAATNLFDSTTDSPLVRRLARGLVPLVTQGSAAGAWPILMAATASDVEPGGYYGPTGFMEAWGKAGRARIGGAARDPAMAGRLWESLNAMTGASWPAS